MADSEIPGGIRPYGGSDEAPGVVMGPGVIFRSGQYLFDKVPGKERARQRGRCEGGDGQP